jgi:hypothetical protein
MIIAMFKKIGEKENKQKTFYNEAEMEDYMDVNHCILLGFDGEAEPSPYLLCGYLMEDRFTCNLSERECTCKDRRYNGQECKQF